MLSLQNANSPKARVLGTRTKREDGSSQVERPQIRPTGEPVLLTAEYPKRGNTFTKLLFNYKSITVKNGWRVPIPLLGALTKWSAQRNLCLLGQKIEIAGGRICQLTATNVQLTTDDRVASSIHLPSFRPFSVTSILTIPFQPLGLQKQHSPFELHVGTIATILIGIPSITKYEVLGLLLNHSFVTVLVTPRHFLFLVPD